jgi:hypothetical protein
MGRREVYKWFWWGKPEGKRPLVRLRRRREDNIMMDSGSGMGDTDCIDLALERYRRQAYGNAVMNLRAP